MTSGKKVECDRSKCRVSRHLKLLAKELEVNCVAISQLNVVPSSGQTRSRCCRPSRVGMLTAASIWGGHRRRGTFVSSCDGERPLVWSLDEQLRHGRPADDQRVPERHKEVFGFGWSGREAGPR